MCFLIATCLVGQFLSSRTWNTDNPILDVALSPDSALLATADGFDEDSTQAVLDDPAQADVVGPPINLRRTTDGQTIRSFVGHTETVLAVAFSPDGQLLASSSTDRTIKVWQVADGQLITTLTQTVGAAMSLSWSPNGHLLAAGDGGQLTMWHVRNWTISTTFVGGSKKVVFSPDGQLVAGVGFDGLHIWRVSDGHLLLMLEVDDVANFAWSPDGQSMAFGNYGDPLRKRAPEVHVYSVIDGRLIGTLIGFPSNHGIFSITWSPDGQLLAAGSGELRRPFTFPDEGWIGIWRVSDWQPLETIQAHRREVRALTFTPDSTWLISGSLDGRIKWWSMKERT